MVGKATPDRGGSRKPPIEWALGLRLNNRRTRKTQRDGHNSGVKIWSLCSVSSTLSHANPWTTLTNPCNKVRGKYVVKEVFLRPLFVRLSFIMRLLSLRRYISSIYMYILHGSTDDFITFIYICKCTNMRKHKVFIFYISNFLNINLFHRFIILLSNSVKNHRKELTNFRIWIIINSSNIIWNLI